MGVGVLTGKCTRDVLDNPGSWGSQAVDLPPAQGASASSSSQTTATTRA